MAGGIGQYLKDTQGELRHVAWPTRTQTIVYTVLVALISVGVAMYLGFFDFLFTTGLTDAVAALPSGNPITVTQQPVAVPSAPVTAVPQMSTTLPTSSGQQPAGQ
jgi:preprotein translocase SecE subunit